jgi:hypothetical protein
VSHFDAEFLLFFCDRIRTEGRQVKLRYPPAILPGMAETIFDCRLAIGDWRFFDRGGRRGFILPRILAYDLRGQEGTKSTNSYGLRIFYHREHEGNEEFLTTYEELEVKKQNSLFLNFLLRGHPCTLLVGFDYTPVRIFFEQQLSFTR